MNKRAQSVVLDLFIALFIFVLINSLLIIMWGKYGNEIDEKVSQKDMWLKSYYITDLLVESPGNPIDWHEGDLNDIKSLGIAEKNRRLNYAKLEKFLDITSQNYSTARKLFNIEGFEFYFKLFDARGPISEAGQNPIFIGGDIPGRTTTIRRYVYSDEFCDEICMCYERKCRIEFSLWELQ